MGKETHRSAEMRRVLEEYAGSGLSRKQFCEERGMALTTFDYWHRELRVVKPQLVQVEVDGGTESVGKFVLRLSNGRQIESAWQFTDAALTRLIRVVESA